MKKTLISITAVTMAIMASCTKPAENNVTPQPFVAPSNPDLDAMAFDYNDGTVDSIFQDNTGRIAKVTFKGSNTVCEFTDISTGLYFTRKDGGSLQNVDTVTYTGSIPTRNREYNNMNALVFVTVFTYHHGNNPSSIVTTVASGNIQTDFVYSGTKLVEMNRANGHNVKYFYSANPRSNSMNSNDKLKNAYTVGSFATYRQITDAMMYSSNLPDSIVYTNGSSVFNWKVTYDTTSAGQVSNVYVNGTKKLSVAY